MPKITLRSCFQKINSHIENYEIEKAENLSLYLLTIFPKSYQAFQCLSKTLLQKQDLTQAERTFDIVLQIFPDDFVSHIGKSMIAESVGRLEDAIYHMRLAFEVEPSNEGLQNELRRLYTAKDGVEPGKIQLTRGGLIRMYMKGGLYSQAAAEARIGISENPDQITHKLALAKSLYEVQDFLKAAETSIEIFSQYPYCWYANEIMNSITSDYFSNTQDNLFRNRLIELDPYYAYWTPSLKTIYDIPDIAVMVEDLDSSHLVGKDLNEIFEHADFSGKNSDQNVKEDISKVDWEAVISNALDLQPNSTSKIEPDPDKVAKLTEEPAMVANKKKLLRDRLRASKNNPASEIAIQDWYFSKDQLTDQSSSGIMQEEISTASSNFQAEDSVIYDLNVEPDIDEISTVQLSKDEWVKEEETISHSADLKINKPGDTQPIAINNKENLSETIASSLKALFGGNRNYAADKIKAAIYKTENSKEIIPLLEDAVISHPEFIELLTLLAEAYQQSGNKEKALETYIKIQNSIQI